MSYRSFSIRTNLTWQKYRFWLQKGVKFQNRYQLGNVHGWNLSVAAFCELKTRFSDKTFPQSVFQLRNIFKCVGPKFWCFSIQHGFQTTDFFKVGLTLSVLVLWLSNVVSNLLTRCFWINFPYGLPCFSQPVWL